jgi:hypothetical protein
MGIIGRFIDDACARHPDLMRRVLDRPFGDLHDWVNFDEEGEACGCLIGTFALCAGVDARRAKDDIMYAMRRVNETMGHEKTNFGEAYEVGVAVSEMAHRLGTRDPEATAWWEVAQRYDATPEGDAKAADLIKRRIARRLGVLTSPVPAEAAHAHH